MNKLSNEMHGRDQMTQYPRTDTSRNIPLVKVLAVLARIMR
jgi:hypothetical protein